MKGVIGLLMGMLLLSVAYSGAKQYMSNLDAPATNSSTSVDVSTNIEPATQLPIDVNVSHRVGVLYDNLHTFTNVTVLAKTDQIVIKKIIMNRGNCNFDPQPTLPRTLKFGQTLLGDVDVVCTPIEISVQTDMGTETYTWSK